MTISLLAALLLACLAAAGYRQGAIRAGTSFFGIMLAALFAGWLGKPVAPLLKMLGVVNPILLWALPPFLVYVVVLAIILWTMLTSSQLIKRGIRINCTMPGPTQTPMMSHFESATKASVLDAFIQPINRRSTPEEQAGPLVYLNSAAASYINGVALPVDGGFMGAMATGQIDLSALMPAA